MYMNVILMSWFGKIKLKVCSTNQTFDDGHGDLLSNELLFVVLNFPLLNLELSRQHFVPPLKET